MFKRWPLFLYVVMIFTCASVGAQQKDKLDELAGDLGHSLNDLGRWTEQQYNDFSAYCAKELDGLEKALKKAQGTASKESKQNLEGVDKDIKHLRKELNEFTGAKKPDQKKAQELDTGIKKTKEKLDAK